LAFLKFLSILRGSLIIGFTMQFFAAEFLSTLLLFVVVLSFIVFIHELGHFLPARYYGIKVDTFSIGFGKEIFGWTDTKGTRWKFSWIPLGGYVKFLGDTDAASTSVDKMLAEEDKLNCLHYRPVKERVIVSFGGPAANYLLAIVLFFSVFFFSGQPEMSSKIDSFIENSPAQSAGLLVGDEIKSINGQQVASLPDILKVMGGLSLPNVDVEVERNGVAHHYMFLANSLKTGESERFILGLKTGRGQRFQLGSSLYTAIALPFQISIDTLLHIKNMILKTSMDGLGGPVAIAKQLKQALGYGVWVVIFFAAHVSVALGFFNLLPIPTLDGGHLMFYGIEAVRGRPVSEKIQEWAFAIGLGALLLLTLFVTYKDVFLK